jgi:hypothetical protein
VQIDDLRSQPMEIPYTSTCWALLERVADSSYLRRAARLRDFLLYVGKSSIKDGHEQIHEQEIGIAVFGRPSTYDTNVDNIVRANASELRRRIKAYFNTEGLHETLIMEIPRGSYVPVFRYRPKVPLKSAEPPSSSASLQSELSENTPEVPFPSPRHPWILAGSIIVGLVILALTAGCLTLWMHTRAMQRSLYAWRYQPALASFWSEFLDSDQDTDVVLPDASFSEVQFLSKNSFSLRDYMNRGYIGKLQTQNQDPNLSAALTKFAGLNLLTPSAVKLAQSILVLDPLKRKMHLYFSREYIPEFVKRDNVVLFGGPIASPWMELFESRLNFTVERSYDRVGHVIDNAPSQSEQETYTANDSVGYCVVAFLPNPGNRGKVLLIQGTDAEATAAGGGILMSEDQLADLQNRLHVTKLPYFEVLLKTSQVPETGLTATIVAYRTYPGLGR